ncbi:aminotransferase class IV [Microbulbifer sp. ALW1]|uniref:aminotransferase class IV n=1 Tax=Microbulbifer sp. (strain ALW1) TaxID=1516059 RepID=UPI00135693A6|nr:aminotransferase class IV [Microbulbifer sp. ALW1]
MSNIPTAPMVKLPTPVSYTAAGAVETLPADADFSAGLLETMRAQSGTIPLLSLHMARFARCAAVGTSELAQIQQSAQQLAKMTASWPYGASIRFRYGLLDQGVRWDFYAVPLEAVSPWGRGVVLQRCETRLDPSASASPFLLAKTRSSEAPAVVPGCKLLRREIYDQAGGEAALQPEPEADAPLKEGLLLDADGLVIECLRSNLLLHKAGRWMTPSLDVCGVRGVMLGWLAGRVEISEDRFSLRDLALADELAVCNGVRGVVPVVGFGEAVLATGPATGCLQQLIAENLW